MDTRERILTIRLMEKLRNNPAAAEKMKITLELKKS